MRRTVVAVACTSIAATFALAGPVEIYREGPQLCPRNIPKTAPVLTETQAMERARTMLPSDFCGPSTFVSGCDAEPEFALSAWRIYFHQYRDSASGKNRGGLSHTYIILDPVGNCLAHIPGTDPGAPR